MEETMSVGLHSLYNDLHYFVLMLLEIIVLIRQYRCKEEETFYMRQLATK